MEEGRKTENKKTENRKTESGAGYHVFLIGILMIIAVAAGGWMFQKRQSQDITLKFGMFAGSYWDVPNGDCYQIIDDAIARFEEKHPGVTVEYEKKSTLNGSLSRSFLGKNRMSL